MVNYPSLEQALQLFDEYKVPRNIRNHCIAVSAVATVFAKQVEAARLEVDVELAQISALFHDFMKAIKIPAMVMDPYFKCDPNQEEVEMQATLKKKFEGMHETQAAHEILKDKWPRVAQLVLSLHDHNPDGTQIFTHVEQKIISFADMCCFVDEIWNNENRTREFLHRKREDYEKRGIYDKVVNNLDFITKTGQELLDEIGISEEELIKKAKKLQEEWMHG